MQPKHLRITFYSIIIAMPLLALINVSQVHHAPLVLKHLLTGNAGNCSLTESFAAEALSRHQLNNVEELKRTSKVISKDDRFSLWQTSMGNYWMPTASGDELLYDLGEQKRDIYGAGIHRGDIVLDAGANVGVFTRKSLEAGAGKVIAIEPGPENLECLRRNFATEIASGRVVIYPKGVWDKDDVLKLSVDPVGSARDSFVRPIENAQVIEAPLTTIDNLVAELKLSKVDFIKMDIEGAERKAIIGARNTLVKFHPRMALCIYHVKGDEVEIPRMVNEARPGYNISKTCLCASNRIQPEVAFFN